MAREDGNKIVYIAGPYSGATEAEVTRNIENARALALCLAVNHVQFVCPHLNSAHFDTAVPQVKYSFWVNMYLALLGRCDAIVTLPNWQRSKGAVAEVEFAKRCGIPVFADLDALIAWYDD